MQLIQIGTQPMAVVPKTVSVREMFEQLASREARMVREARERLLQQVRSISAV
jgi:hypothetical protein